MTGPVVAVLVAMLAACTVLVVLVIRHLPTDGLLPWLRESFRSVRPEHGAAAPATVSSAVEQPTAHVGDLLEMGEAGPAYHRPPDLLEMVGRRRLPR